MAKNCKNCHGFKGVDEYGGIICDYKYQCPFPENDQAETIESATLTVADVSEIEFDFLSDMELYGRTPEDAQAAANYIAGIHDMAFAVRRAISERVKNA